MDVKESEIKDLREDQMLPTQLMEARAAADAILSLCQSKSNRYYLLKSGGILVIAKLMKSRNFNLMLPTVGILQECAAEGIYKTIHKCTYLLSFKLFRTINSEEYRTAIRTLNMFEPIVKLLSNNRAPIALKEHCAKAIGKCSLETASRDTLKNSGAIDALMRILQVI
jgi:hypothetical protein